MASVALGTTALSQLAAHQVALGTTAVTPLPPHQVALGTTAVTPLPQHQVALGTTAITPLPQHQVALGIVAIPAAAVHRIVVGLGALQGFVTLTPLTGASTVGGSAALGLALLLIPQSAGASGGGAAQLVRVTPATVVILSTLAVQTALGGVLPDAAQDALTLHSVTVGGGATLVGGIYHAPQQIRDTLMRAPGGARQLCRHSARQAI